MAARKFITNTAETVSLDVEDVNAVLVQPDAEQEKPTIYQVIVRTSWLAGVVFETSSSFATAKQKRADIIAGLDGEES